MAGSASVALGAFARRFAKAAAGDRRGIGSAAARSTSTAAGLARHGHQRRRASSSTRAAGEDWSFVSGALGAVAGWMMTMSLFSVLKSVLEKDADVHKAEATNAFLRAELRKRDEEIERLEKVWEEEVAARQKKLEQ